MQDKPKKSSLKPKKINFQQNSTSIVDSKLNLTTDFYT